MQSVYRLLAKCAPTNSTVMLTGESGTGKELIARAIHYNSLRKDRPFIPVDCNALSEMLLESELFGYVKGALTGTVANKKGILEIADGGTLFLDKSAMSRSRPRPSRCGSFRNGSSRRRAIPRRRLPTSD
jgi:two-component system NtrC family response regulator